MVSTRWVGLGFLVVTMLAGCQPVSESTKPNDEQSISVSEQPLTTLERIKRTQTINLSYRDASVPFSYIAKNPNQPIGYAQDLQEIIVKAVKNHLNMPDLQVNYHLINSQNRLQVIEDGVVDLSCGSTTNTDERQKAVNFSLGFYVADVRLLTHINSDIKGFADLAGKTVVTTKGATSEAYINAMNTEQNKGIKLITMPDHNESFLMLEHQRADAMVLDDVLLLSKKVFAREPNDWHIVGDSITSEIYGCMMQSGDQEFKALVDKALVTTYNSGEIYNLYNKWFKSPIPPADVNLNFPMSEKFKQFLDKPHDKSTL